MRRFIKVSPLLILLFLLILAACGGRETPQAAETQPESPTSQAATEQPQAPVEPEQAATAGGEAANPVEAEAEKVEPAAADTVENNATSPDDASAVDLKPYVRAFLVTYDTTCCNGKVIDEIEFLFDSTQVQLPGGYGGYPHPVSDAFTIGGVCLNIPVEYGCFSIGTEAEIPDRFTLDILEGEIEISQPDGSVVTGPFFLEVSKSDLIAKEEFLASIEPTSEPAPDLSAAVDLAPYVVGLETDLEAWDDIGLESFIWLTLDGTKVEGVNQDPLNFPTSRDISKFSVIKPEPIPVAIVETALDEARNQLSVRIWLEKDFSDTVVLYIAEGELEAFLPDGQTSGGPFVVQMTALSSATPQVMVITDPAALASTAEPVTPVETTESDSASAGDQLPALSQTGDLPLLPVLVGDKWGFINQAGQMVIEPQFADVHAFSFPTFAEGLEPVEVGEKYSGPWGYIDRTGKFVIEPQFESANQFHDGLANFSIDKKIGYMDTTGQIIIEPQLFQNAFPFSEGRANFNLNGQWGSFDTSGQMVIQPQFDEAWAFSEGLAAVRVGNKWGYINQTGEFVIEPQFDNFKGFSDGLAAVEMGGQIKYIDPTGQVVLDPPISGASYSSFAEGLAPVKVGEKYGFMDKTGQMIIEPQFDVVYSFAEGLAGVQRHSQELYGYINAMGQVVIQLPIEFPSDPQQKEVMQKRIILGNFFEGVAMLKINGHYGYIDKTGNYIWNPLTNSPGTSNAAESTGDTISAPTPTPGQTPPAATPTPAPQPAQGPQPGTQEYLLTALTTALQMVKAVDQVKQLLQNPLADRSAWTEAISAQAEVVQTGHNFLTNLTPPADLQDEHATLLTGSAACAQTTSLIVDGVKNRNQDSLNSAGPLMTTCGQKLVEATKMFQDYVSQ